jgi:hypothetical protein
VNHSDIQSRMADYLEGDLSLGKRALFDAHLDACTTCKGELTEMRETIGLLRRLPTPEPPVDLADNVMRRIRAGEGQPGLADRLARWFAELNEFITTPRFAVPATALAAGLAVALVSGETSLRVPSFQISNQETQVARRTSGPAAQQLSEEQIQNFADALAGLRAESIADNSLPSGSRLGMSGPATGSDSPRTPLGISRSGAADQSLELASAATAGGAQEQSLRTRDEWLDVLIEQPGLFAAEHAGLSAVEQELWITHLSRRAVELGRLEDVVAALRGTSDPAAVALGDSFAAAARLR